MMCFMFIASAFLSHPFHPLLSIVRTSSSHVAHTLLSLAPAILTLISLSPGSCSLIQLGQCNLLQKKCHNVVITPVGDLARVVVEVGEPGLETHTHS